MRVALAQALYAEPDILMLDEPNNFLDICGEGFCAFAFSLNRSSMHSALSQHPPLCAIQALYGWKIFCSSGLRRSSSFRTTATFSTLFVTASCSYLAGKWRFTKATMTRLKARELKE
jgi:hypothetical protein